MGKTKKKSSRKMTEAAKAKLRATRAVPRISAELLRGMGACAEERWAFEKLFGKAAKVAFTPENVGKALLAGLNVSWIAARLRLLPLEGELFVRDTISNIDWAARYREQYGRGISENEKLESEVYGMTAMLWTLPNVVTLLRAVSTPEGKKLLKDRLAVYETRMRKRAAGARRGR